MSQVDNRNSSAAKRARTDDLVVAEATLEFLNLNKHKLLTSFSTILTQFFPLLLKLIAWNREKLERLFRKVFPTLISPGSFLPLFPALVDLPRSFEGLVDSCISERRTSLLDFEEW